MSSGGPPDDNSPPLPTVGAYQLLDAVGAGAAGVVYRARHQRTGRLVALKRARALDVGELGSLRREVHALGRIRHRGVALIVDHGVSDGLPWYAMELLAGETLRQWLDRHPHPRRGPARAQALRLVERLCQALAFIHGEGIVHRDLKPENVFVDRERGPVLVDFGLMVQRAGRSARERLDLAGAGVGSLDYMAPEQLHGGSVDARADLYSLGCILHELLAGTPPFPGGNWSAAAPPPLDADVPETLRELVARLVTHEPRRRLGYATDVAAVLASVDQTPLEPAQTPRSYLYRPGFVGRAEVVAQIARGLDAARRGRGEALFVGGPSGTGKTRLAVEAVGAARGQRAVVSECEPLDSAQPLHALLPLVQALADHCRVQGEAECQRLLGTRGRVLAAHWPELATLPGQERYPALPPLAGRAARERLLEALVDCTLLFAGRKPLLLVFDDLQWADEMTLELIERLEAAPIGEHPLFVLGTFRSDETERLQRWLERRHALVRLAPLDEPAIASIIGDMLALDSAPPRLVEAVASHAEGNPLFVGEYLRAAIDETLVRRDRWGQWHVPESTGPGSVGALDVPVTLRALILHRIARLGDGARRLVHRAAVLGRDFPADWLERFSPLGEGETLDAINELLARELIEAAPGGQLRFVHDKLREVAYAELTEAERRALHGVAARMIEAREPQRRDRHALLARHFALAGVDDKALEHVERAAEYALAVGAHHDALAFGRQALELDARHAIEGVPARRARWHQLVGEAAFAIGDLPACHEALRRAVELLHRRLPSSRRGWTALLFGETARQGVGLVRDRRPRRPSGDEAQRDRAASLAAAKIAEAAYFTGDVLVMLAANVLAANLAEKAGSEADVPRAYAQLGYTAGFLRLSPLRKRYFARARRVTADPAHAGARACVAYIEALHHLGFGQWSAAERAAAEAVTLLAGAGDRQEHEIAQTMLAQAEFFSGRFAAAQARFAEVRESARVRRNQQHQAWGAYGAARSLLALGRTDEAGRLLDEADTLLPGHADQASEIICNGLQAMVAERRGDRAAALGRAERALAQLVTTPPTVFSTVHGYDGALEVYAAAAADGDAGAVVAMRRGCASLRRFARAFPMARPTWLRHRGGLLAHAGQARAARRTLGQARAAARQLEMPLEEALAELALATSTPAPLSVEHMNRARALLQELGCAYHQRRCELELGRGERR